MKVFTETETLEARKTKDGYQISAENKAARKRHYFRAEAILIAAGRKSSADLLKVEKGGASWPSTNPLT